MCSCLIINALKQKMTDPKLQDYIDDILSDSILSDSSQIFGGYVYKCLVRGECDDINDLDVIIGYKNISLKRISSKLLSKCTARYLPGEEFFESQTLDCKCFDTPTNKIQIDLVPYAEGPQTFTNSLRLTKTGIVDGHDNDNVKDFVINNLKKGRYCKWKGMRPKDKEYFKDFEEINPNECESYGFLYDYPKNMATKYNKN